MIIPFGVYEDGSTPKEIVDHEFAMRMPGNPVTLLEAKYLSGDRGVDAEDPNDLAETGWGVIFGRGVNMDIRLALTPLLNCREEQAGKRYRVFKDYGVPGKDENGKEQSAEDWLTGWGAKNITVDPDLLEDPRNPGAGVPYYLLIVASPEDISFKFQMELDSNWAVGRIWFDTAAEFADYAKSVVDYETCGNEAIPTKKEMVIFGTENDGDEATYLLMQQVVKPLFDSKKIGEKQGFAKKKFLANNAYKKDLVQVLHSDRPPALLFTGTHGQGIWNWTDESAELTGALLCQDWKKIPGGPPPAANERFAASDLKDTANVHGMIHFMFACLGVGWPKTDAYVQPGDAPAASDGRRAMISRLAQRLLAHPNGGALAIFGHVDRAFASSFQTNDGKPQTHAFTIVIKALLRGTRIGHATDEFNRAWANEYHRWSELKDSLAGRPATEDEKDDLMYRWISTVDVKSFIVFGDPAVCLRVDDMGVDDMGVDDMRDAD